MFRAPHVFLFNMEVWNILRESHQTNRQALNLEIEHARTPKAHRTNRCVLMWVEKGSDTDN